MDHRLKKFDRLSHGFVIRAPYKSSGKLNNFKHVCLSSWYKIPEKYY